MAWRIKLCALADRQTPSLTPDEYWRDITTNLTYKYNYTTLVWDLQSGAGVDVYADTGLTLTGPPGITSAVPTWQYFAGDYVWVSLTEALPTQTFWQPCIEGIEYIPLPPPVNACRIVLPPENWTIRLGC